MLLSFVIVVLFFHLVLFWFKFAPHPHGLETS